MRSPTVAILISSLVDHQVSHCKFELPIVEKKSCASREKHYATFFLLGDQKMIFFALHGAIKCTLWHTRRKIIFSIALKEFCTILVYVRNVFFCLKYDLLNEIRLFFRLTSTIFEWKPSFVQDPGLFSFPGQSSQEMRDARRWNERPSPVIRQIKPLNCRGLSD